MSEQEKCGNCDNTGIIIDTENRMYHCYCAFGDMRRSEERARVNLANSNELASLRTRLQQAESAARQQSGWVLEWEQKCTELEARLRQAEVENKQLREWKGAEQQALISIGTALLNAGYTGDSVVNGVQWLEAELAAMRDVVEAANIEHLAEVVHDAWWQESLRQGRSGEQSMVPYADLPNDVQEYDRVTVRAVLAALKSGGEK